MTDAGGALEAVARRFSATLDQSRQFSPAQLAVDGRRVALEFSPIAVRADRQDVSSRPHLRFDKVVLRVTERLRKALGPRTPDGTAVLWTISAPIRLPGKTTTALQARIDACLAGGPTEIEDLINGNSVRVRLVRGAPRLTSKVIGFVHSETTEPRLLLDVAQSLLEGIGAATDRPAPPDAEGWLALIAENVFWIGDAWRQVFAQLGVETGFAKIVLAFPGGRVESLTA